MNEFYKMIVHKFYMFLHSSLIILELLLISIGIVVTFDKKTELFKSKK